LGKRAEVSNSTQFQFILKTNKKIMTEQRRGIKKKGDRI